MNRGHPWASPTLRKWGHTGGGRPFVGRCSSAANKKTRKVMYAVALSVYLVISWRMPSMEVDFDPDSLPRCTYQQLRVGFGPIHPNIMHSNNNASCLDVRQQIMDIPVQAIVNRNRMPKVGNGFYGVVHKAVIHLPKTQQRQCVVAVKTDPCHKKSLWFILRKYRYRRTGYSCLADDAFLGHGDSHLGGEYNGLLITQSVANQLDQLPGWILPWGVVSLAKPLPTWFSRSSLAGIPSPDPQIAGVIFPLLTNMVTLQDALDESNQTGTLHPLLPRTPWDLISFVLPAARALKHVHSLGLAHQDILPQNIGIRLWQTTNRSYAVLMDHTFLSLQEPSACTHPICHELCNTSIHRGMRRIPPLPGPKRLSTLQKDVIRWRLHLLHNLVTDQIGGGEKTLLIRMRGVTNATHLVQILEDRRQELSRGLEGIEG